MGFFQMLRSMFRRHTESLAGPLRSGFSFRPSSVPKLDFTRLKAKRQDGCQFKRTWCKLLGSFHGNDEINLYYWVLEAWVGPVIFPLTNEIGKCVWRLWTCLLENSRLFSSHFFNCLGIKIKMGRRRKVPGEPCYAPTFGAACELALR